MNGIESIDFLSQNQVINGCFHGLGQIEFFSPYRSNNPRQIVGVGLFFTVVKIRQTFRN